MSRTLRLELALPGDFRAEDILAFHRRDAQQIAERVGPSSLQKALLWGDAPACLLIGFQPGLARAELLLDATPAAGSQALFEAMVRRMLGLTQPVQLCEQCFRDHPQLGPLLARQAGLRVPQTATPFEALTWAVAGQQISVAAAVGLRRKLILACDLRHDSGLWCYPGAAQIASLGEARLRQAGFSGSKSGTLLTLATLVAQRQLPLDDWLQRLPVEEIRERLLAIRGIGPWTVNYVLLRGFGWLDGSLHGDVAVRRGLQTLLGAPDKISAQGAETWLASFAPWRALIAAHLWAAQSSGGY